MSETEWFCGVQLGGVKLPAEFPAARNSKSMVHAGTGRWRQKNGRPMLIVGSRWLKFADTTTERACLANVGRERVAVSKDVYFYDLQSQIHFICES